MKGRVFLVLMLVALALAVRTATKRDVAARQWPIQALVLSDTTYGGTDGK